MADTPQVVDSLERIRKALENPRLSDCEWIDERNLHWHQPTTYVTAPEFGHKVVRLSSIGDFTCTVGKSENEWANAAFVAAANPVAIRSLLAREAALREALEKIAAFAVGEGDVCEIIAKRARSALAST